MRRLVIAAMLLALPLTSKANWADLFDWKRDASGQLVEVSTKEKIKFEIMPVVHKVFEDWKEYKQWRSSQEQTELAELAMGPQANPKEKQKFLGRMKRADKAVRKIDFESAMQSPQFFDVMRKFEDRLNHEFISKDVVARLDDPTYFYRREVRDEVLDWAVGIATSNLVGTIADLAFYVFKHAYDMLELRRSYYQFILLYGVDSTPHFNFLTMSENQLTLSSIMDGQTQWWEVWNAKSAKKDWQNFGTKEWADWKTEMAKREAKIPDQDIRSSLSWGSAFRETVNRANGRFIWDLAVDNRILSDKPSLAFDYANPRRVRNKRIVNEMLILGIHATPIPGPAKRIFIHSINKTYKSQMQVEGALYASLIDANQMDLAGEIVEQSINPFIIRELK